MIFKSSDRAKKGTGSQIDGIISFLENQLKIQYKEKDKFLSYGIIGKNAVSVIEKNIASTTKSLEYYIGVKEKYQKQGLI